MPVIVQTGEWWAIKLEADIVKFGWKAGETHVGLVIGHAEFNRVLIVYFPQGDGIYNFALQQFVKHCGEVQNQNWCQADDVWEDYCND